MPATQTLTARTFDRFADRDDYLGFGYIGGRCNALDDGLGKGNRGRRHEVAEADAAILLVTGKDGLGWDEDRLFEWANSKDGRQFADMAFGCDDLAGALQYLR